MNWKLWLEGLGAAALSGAVTGATQAVSAGQIGKGTGIAAAVGALLGVGVYLKQPAFATPPPVIQPPVDPPPVKGA